MGMKDIVLKQIISFKQNNGVQRTKENVCIKKKLCAQTKNGLHSKKKGAKIKSHES